MNPATAERLRFNILTNWPEATVLNCAVAKSEEELEVTLGIGSTSDSLRGSKGSTALRPVTVRTRRLDDISGDFPIDILKIDIEGAEQDVLFNPGHEDTLKRARALVIEIHHLETAEAVHAAIEAQGLMWIGGPNQRGIGQHIFAR